MKTLRITLNEIEQATLKRHLCSCAHVNNCKACTRNKACLKLMKKLGYNRAWVEAAIKGEDYYSKDLIARRKANKARQLAAVMDGE